MIFILSDKKLAFQKNTFLKDYRRLYYFKFNYYYQIGDCHIVGKYNLGIVILLDNMTINFFQKIINYHIIQQYDFNLKYNFNSMTKKIKL